jgi:protein-disulfide isomerase
MNSTWKLLGIIVLVLAVVIGLAVWLQAISPEKATPNPDIKGEKTFTRPYSYMTGKADAKVQVVEFADLQCPFCAQASAPVKAVVDKYKANPDFNFVYRHFPLGQHSHAQEAAQAAEAAGSQGKFWEMVELLYSKQNDWAGSVSATSIFVNLAGQLGLDTNKFREEVSASKYIDNITQDYMDGEALGVNSTPTFFFNGQKLDSHTELDSKIAEALAK